MDRASYLVGYFKNYSLRIACISNVSDFVYVITFQIIISDFGLLTYLCSSFLAKSNFRIMESQSYENTNFDDAYENQDFGLQDRDL